MTEPSVIFAVDHGAESVGPILPILAKLLIEIEIGRRNTDELQRGNHPKAKEPSGSARTQEVYK